jgi:PAS domain S-box-containing protein
VESTERVTDFRFLAETLPHMVWTARADGTPEYFNRRGLEYTGTHPGALDGLTWLSLIHPDDHACVREGFGRAQATRATYELDYRLRRFDGSFRWHVVRAVPVCSDAGEILQWLGTCTDVDDERRARAELVLAEHRSAESAALLDTLLDSMPIGFAFVDRSFRYVRVNRVIAETNGIPVDAHIGRTPAELVPEIAAGVDRHLRAVLETEKAVVGIELSLRSAAIPGLRHWIGSFYPVWVDGAVTGVGVVAFDVTDTLAKDAQLSALRSFEAMGRLAGGIAHDFNNLLMVISGAAGLLARAISRDDPRSAFVQDVTDAAARAATLTRQLLAFGRRQRVARQRIDVARVVLEAAPFLRRVAGDDVRLSVAHRSDDGSSPRVGIEPSELEQVLLNLVVNARDAMPGGGALDVEVGRVEIAEARMTTTARLPPGRYAYLDVRDDGVGIGGELLPRVFEPFFTTKPPGKGTGLGLATVHGIVHQIGGAVDVRARPGRGTTFTIYLPEREIDGPAEPLDATSEPGGGATLLVVDDERGVREVMRRMLELEGFSVAAASDGEEALRVAASLGERLAGVVTDVSMPGMTGCELAERLKREHRVGRVLLVSGFVGDHGDCVGCRVVAAEPLRKPFSHDELVAAVRRVLDAPTPTA